MKSIKPGRGPQIMGGIMGIFVMVPFSLVFFYIAWSGGAPIPFLIVAGLFVVAFLAMAVYNFIGATRKNRPSLYDIVDSRDEPDPMNMAYGNYNPVSGQEMGRTGRSNYCPYCGNVMEFDHLYCKQCGKRV